MADVDNKKLEQVEKEVRGVVAEETGDLLKKYFAEALEDTRWGVSLARQEYENALAEYGHASKILCDEAQRRGIYLEPSLPATTACRRKKAKGATGPKVAPQKCSPRKA